MTHHLTDTTTALDAFLAAKAEIDAMLERLAALSAAHFETHPDKIDWGHVGNLNHICVRLRHITDSAFQEGEYAESTPWKPQPSALPSASCPTSSTQAA